MTTINQLSALTALAATNVIEIDDQDDNADSNKATLALLGHLEIVERNNDANFTMVVGEHYQTSLDAWTANRTWTLPATAQVGERIAVTLKNGSATQHMTLTAGAGGTLNGVAGGTEWSRIFISGETVAMKCVATPGQWIVEMDGRVACKCRLDFDDTQSVLNGWNQVEVNNIVFDTGDLGDVSTNQWDINIRRAGKYLLMAGTGLLAVPIDGRTLAGIYKNGSLSVQSPRWYVRNRDGSNPQANEASVLSALELAVGDSIELFVNHNITGTNITINPSPDRVFLVAVELLEPAP